MNGKGRRPECNPRFLELLSCPSFDLRKAEISLTHYPLQRVKDFHGREHFEKNLLLQRHLLLEKKSVKLPKLEDGGLGNSGNAQI